MHDSAPRPRSAALDTALSRALLDLVARGESPETLRLYRPDDVLAFSGLDAARPGFARAVQEARQRGFAPAFRLAGGRAAVFHRETIAFAWTQPVEDPRAGIAERFREAAEWIRDALAGLGVDARIGEVAGEYCPGEWSVNARGARKLMGVGQRVIRGAAHVGGVILVQDAARARDVLVPVYAALDYPLDPETVGAIEDECRGARRDDVVDALLAALAARAEVATGDASIFARAALLAREIEPRHAIVANDLSPRA